ncbi:MAG TPA: hypothetical protein VFV86_10815 [Nitrososphaeraceae archaeon]|nr:hypothetical protein [Nitrososphaeraceae archaeon]
MIVFQLSSSDIVDQVGFTAIFTSSGSLVVPSSLKTTKPKVISDDSTLHRVINVGFEEDGLFKVTKPPYV